MDGKAPSLSPLPLLPRALPLRFTLRLPDGFLHALLLALLGSALLLTRLTCPLLEPEEARYAEIPRQMLAEGRFVEPVLHGQPYYQKPPLLYWLVMLSYSVFGVHDWAARLVPALASLATVFVTWFWARSAFGPRIGLGCAIVLILSARFVYLGRMLTIDPLLSLWVTAALASAYLAVHEAPLKRRWWIASAILTGLGLLTKGPVALVLVLVPVAIFQILGRASRRKPDVIVALACYLGIAIAVACPWYVAMAINNPEAAGDFFWLHHVQRYLDPLDHEEPVWFFLPWLFAGTLPWSLVLVSVFAAVIKRAAHEVSGLCTGSNRLLRARLLCERTLKAFPSGLLFALLACGWCVVFFSLSGCKRAVYILPALPWLGACLGYGVCMPTLRVGMAPLLKQKTLAASASVVFVLLFVGVYVLLPGYHRRFAMRGQIRRHQEAAMKVFSYPKRWDSVSYYLQQNAVRVFTADRRAELIAALQAESESLLFVKNAALPEILRDLPASMEFVEVGRQGTTLRVGIIRSSGTRRFTPLGSP
jgi:4-amino-4-deoxy-L-arabinose transferase-like glycosyltransferase